MTQSESFERKFQRRISAITCGAQVEGMSANSLKVLTNDFEEQYVKPLIGKSSAPADQLRILEAIEKAFDDIHIIAYNINVPQYDRDIPDYFEQFRLDLELGEPINDYDIEIPQRATDTKFEDLCKLLIEQRLQFEKINKSLYSFLGRVEKGDPTYKKISSVLKDYEAKRDEYDELQENYKILATQLEEAQKMNKKLAEKSDDKVVERVIRQYLNQSKRKSTAKKEHIKNIIDEMVKSANIELPDDLKAILESFDNETPAHIEKAEIYEEGSIKNENCKQLTVTPNELPNIEINALNNRPNTNRVIDDLPF